MRCISCESAIRVKDGYCVSCRVHGPKPPKLNPPAPRLISPLFSMLPLLVGLIILCFTLGTHYDFLDIFWTPKTQAGQLAAEEPLQYESKIRPWNHNGHLFKSLASYEITARVLLKSNYWFSPDSQLSPIDITFGWGMMSDQSILDQMSLSSGYRSYSWKAGPDFLYSIDEINRNAANHHLIPKDSLVHRKLRSLPISSVVTLKGHLVEISRADGWNWRSSLTREDAGGGACEVMWVEQVITH